MKTLIIIMLLLPPDTIKPDTTRQVHEFLKLNFNTKEVVCEQTGEILQIVKSTTENSTVEMEEYMEVCRRKALEMFNVIIPLPNEQIEAEFTVSGL